jgi:hypothetical protein
VDPHDSMAFRNPLKRLGKKLTRGRIGLVLGPLLILLVCSIPEPASMMDIVEGINAGDGPDIPLKAP